MSDPTATTKPGRPGRERDDDRDGDDGDEREPAAASADAPTGVAMGSQPTVEAVHATGDTALAGAGPPPAAAPLDLAVARAKTAAALFGEAEAVKVGRYRVIERAGAGGMGVVWSAWDPELGRGVALKLASAGDAAARARARDEGRALGRLSHPNVVPIYDVLEHDDGIFLVMELVKGETLRAAAERQTPAQIVRAYRQAGEGLAAAHEAGLIHRDFKPDNAILGADGRVRVLDFGLAHAVDPDGAADPAAIAGTPRYMAPEQRAGDALTPAVDQYALCVALRESLARRGPVPRWLAPILARGTAEAPGDRYPSMHALLRALAHDPAWRWRRRAAVALGVVALGAIGGAFVLGRAGVDDRACEGGPALIAAAWSPARKQQLAAHLATLRTPYALDVAPRIVAALDGYATDWVAIHRGSCRAHRRGEISATLHDRRAGCLARRKAALDAVTDLAAAAAAPGLSNLVVAVGQLPDVATCEDDAALLSPVEPPAPARAPEAAAIADAIARVDVERDAGHFDDARRNADLAVGRAEVLGYAPLRARALLGRGRIDLVTRQRDRGLADFTAATRLALAAGDFPVAIEAYARQIWAAAMTGDPAAGADGLALVEALTEGVGDRARFARALLHLNVGGVALSRGERTAARASFERALGDAAQVDGAGAIELTAVLTNLVIVVDDDPARRDALAAELITRRTRLLGANHPQTLIARILAAQLQDDPARVRAALAPACRDLARYHPALGRDLGECAFELAWLATVAGDRAAVPPLADIATAAASAGAEPSAVAMTRAYRRLALGDTAGALLAFTAVRARAALGDDAPWWRRLPAADAALGAALARLAAGDRRGAALDLADADRTYERIAAAMPPPVLARRRAAVAQLGR